MQIHIAKDDAKLLRSLVHVFENYRFTVDGASDGEQVSSERTISG